MATVFNFRCTEQTQAGVNKVITVDPMSRVSQLQIVCVTGKIAIEGESGEILGVPVSPISLVDGQAFNFNENCYQLITITIFAGTTYRLIANQ